MPRTLWGLKVHRDMPLVPSVYNFSHVVDWLLEFKNAEPKEGLNKSWMMRAGSESWRESRRRAA